MAPETLKELRLPNSPESASRARAAVHAWLGEAHPAYEPVRLAVSELVTNAVRHGRHGVSAQGADEHGSEPLVLRVSECDDGDRVRVEVTDRGLTAGTPRVRPDTVALLAESIPADPAFLLAEGGRGLAIVDMLSRGRWGFHPNADGLGRTVWCEIAPEHLEAPRPPGAPYPPAEQSISAVTSSDI
ncbi:ATP-binding protein [Sphaerisporangium dianthi]|uniref:ATP-binding protein n=1 Tax=Sphaerisporangium dianthi TaxID=1436120 RepID=A0ABV9CMQ1_9ACTN